MITLGAGDELTTLRAYESGSDHQGSAKSAHRILQAGGRVSPQLRGAAGDPDQAISRLKSEGIWDTTRNRAREDHFINAARLRQLEAP